VEEFNKAIDTFKAVGGYFVHTGKTGKKSYQNTAGRVHIISGKKLLDLIT
jgi:restriction endonuclease Mrr